MTKPAIVATRTLMAIFTIIAIATAHAEGSANSKCDWRSNPLNLDGRTYAERKLCAKKDAKSLLGAYLLSYPISATSDDYDTRSLVRAYAVGKTDLRINWIVALTESIDEEEFRGEWSRERVVAATRLTKLDANNAMSWLTLAYVLEQTGSPGADYNVALTRAASCPTFHDYSFDLLKATMEASQDFSREISEDDRWYYAIMSQAMLPPSTALEKWLERECHSEGRVVDSVVAGSCNDASKLLAKGDSLPTLSRKPELVKELLPRLRVMIGPKNPRALRAAMLASRSYIEFLSAIASLHSGASS